MKKAQFHTTCLKLPSSEAVAQRCSVRKGNLKNFPILTGKQQPCWSLFLTKLHAFIIKKCFPVNIAKFLRTPILKNIRLLLSRSHDQSPFPVEGENLWL